MVPDPWPANASFGSEGLRLAGVSAGSLAEEFGTPLLVMDEDDVRARCRVFAEAFPRVLYAIKAFTAATIIRIAQEEGLGLLVASGGELEACLRAGADAAGIAFHGNNKSDRELELAVRSRIGLVIADNPDELERLDAVARRESIVQPILFRVAPGVSGDTHAYLDTGGLDSKFGTPLAEGQALDGVKRAIAMPGLDLRGLHTHVGSQLLDSEPFIRDVDAVFDFLAEVRDVLGYEAGILDLGGGFGVSYTDEQPPDVPQLASAMLEEVRLRAEERRLPVPSVIVEPGRSIVANPVVTLYRVGGVKEVPSGRTFVAVDGGMSDNIRPVLYGAKYSVALAGPPRDSASMRFTIVGMHCESGDVLAESVELPEDIRPGDLIAFAATGAYGYSMASNYNRVGRPAVAAVEGGAARLVLRREDPGILDRLATDSPPEPVTRPPDGVEIRAAQPRDAASFHSMWTEVIEEGLVRSQEVSRPVRHYRMLFRRAWTERSAWIVAAFGERVVGLVSLSREEHPVTAHVASLGISVDAGFRRRGIGGALMSEAFKWARSVGVEKIMLSVYPDNHPAISLYRKFGFFEEGRLVAQSKKSYGYLDEITMGRWLGDPQA